MIVAYCSKATGEDISVRPNSINTVLTSSSSDLYFDVWGASSGRRLRYSDKNTRRIRFQRCMLGRSSADASSYVCRISKRHLNYRQSLETHRKLMPNPWKRIGDDVKYIDTLVEEWDVIIPNPAVNAFTTRTRNEPGPPVVRGLPIRSGKEPVFAQSPFRIDHMVVKPCCVGEI